MKVMISEDELQALGDVSMEATRFYLLAIKPCVDVRTSIVGRGASRVSRGVMAINAQYIPPQGSRRPAWKPSLREVDVMIDELTRAGLVKRVATPQEFKKLVLRLPLMATPDEVRADSERRLNGSCHGESEGVAESPAIAGFALNSGIGERESYPQGDGAISQSHRVSKTPSGAISNITHFAQAREERAAAGVSRVSQVVKLLRQHGAVASPRNGEVVGWVAQGISDTVLIEACAIAVQRRAQQGSTQSISPAYLAPIVDDVINGLSSAPGAARRVCSDGKSEKRLAGGKGGWRDVPPREVHAAAPAVTTTGPALAGGDDAWVE